MKHWWFLKKAKWRLRRPLRLGPWARAYVVIEFSKYHELWVDCKSKRQARKIYMDYNRRNNHEGSENVEGSCTRR